MSAWTPTPSPGDAEGLYAVLGLSPHSTVTEVRQAHRREAAVWHPDRCTDPSAEARIRWINKARDLLVDSDERRAYDLASAHWFEVTLEHTRIDAGMLRQGANSVARCRVRVHGSHPRLHEIDLPRYHDTWWRVDVVAVDDATDPEALFDLEFTFTGDSPGLKADCVDFAVADRWISVEVMSTVKRPSLLHRTVRRWQATPTRAWSPLFHHWCVLGFLGLLPAGWYLSYRVNQLALTGDIAWRHANLFDAALLGIGVVALALAAITNWFRQGTWRARLLVGAFTIPGVTAAMIVIALTAAVVLIVALVLVTLAALLSVAD